MRKFCFLFLILPGVAFSLWLLPPSLRLAYHLWGIPLVWFLISLILMRADSPWAGLLGKRKFWPLLWVLGLLALSLGFLGVGYLARLVIFSYGLPRFQTIKPLLAPLFLSLAAVLTFGVERPLRQILLKGMLLDRGVCMPIAMGLCAVVGTLRSVPFYGMGCLETRWLFFALLNLFIFEWTLCRLYLASGNLLACGFYHALHTLLAAFVLSDVLGPYLPAFHWVSSSNGFYLLMSSFNLLPYLILSCLRPVLIK